MKTTNTTSNGLVSLLGTIMMISWTVVVGLGGLLLLLAIFYATMSNSLTLTVVCSFFLFIPVLVTLIWGFFMVEDLTREWTAGRAISVRGPQAETSADVVC
ncbi:MAG: hypothetical protein LDL33_01825 [Desulfomonile sp.]|nr:hypothetical protein [Desulfomonile sp.]